MHPYFEALKLAIFGKLACFFGHKTFVNGVLVLDVYQVTSDGWIASKREGCLTSLISFVKTHNPFIWAISAPSSPLT